MRDNIISQVFVSMRFNRRYSAGFIARRQGLSVSAVRSSLAVLVQGGVVERFSSPVDGRRKLYVSKQQSLRLW